MASWRTFPFTLWSPKSTPSVSSPTLQENTSCGLPHNTSGSHKMSSLNLFLPISCFVPDPNSGKPPMIIQETLIPRQEITWRKTYTFFTAPEIQYPQAHSQIYSRKTCCNLLFLSDSIPNRSQKPPSQNFLPLTYPISPASNTSMDTLWTCQLSRPGKQAIQSHFTSENTERKHKPREKIPKQQRQIQKSAPKNINIPKGGCQDVSIKNAMNNNQGYIYTIKPISISTQLKHKKQNMKATIWRW